MYGIQGNGIRNYQSMMGMASMPSQDALLNTILSSLAQGNYNTGFQDGFSAGFLSNNQIRDFQQVLGQYTPQQLAAAQVGYCPGPDMGLSGPPAGKGLMQNPAGWPANTTMTAGGYKVVPEGNTSWKVYGPDQKPGDKPLTHVHGDPHVDEKDGTRWDFTKSSDFVLPDGTRIACKTSSDTGYSVSVGLDITNGMDHVSVTGLDGKPKVSSVTQDGYEFRAQHLAAGGGQEQFRMGGDGDDWFLERNGQSLGEIKSAHMDAKTGRYEQTTNGQPYSIDPALKPPFGSEAWGNMLRNQSFDQIPFMGLPPELANRFGQMFRKDHAEQQYEDAIKTLQQYQGPYGQTRALFRGPGDAFRAVFNMGDAMNSLMGLNQDLQRQMAAFNFR